MSISEENGMSQRHPELWDEPDYIRKEMARTMDHIYSHGMTTTSGGNMSVIDSLGNIWITPSGTDKGSLKSEEVVCVAPDGNFEGLLKPSMEYPLHRAIYNSRPDIRAVIHAHPPMLTSFSIVHRTPDTSILRNWLEICGTAGYAVYATPGSDLMAENVASEFRNGHDTVIMENHAAVAGGKDLAEALARLETLEYCARTIYSAGFIGEIGKPEYVNENKSGLSPGNQGPQSGHNPRPREKGSVISPEDELIAEEICRMAARACNRGLMYGFSGSISVRREGERFLFNRKRILRYDIGKEDIADVRYGVNTHNDELSEGPESAVSSSLSGTVTRAGDTICGPDAWLHAEIYRRLPSVNAVITAQPPYLMAFAVTGKEFDARTIPESWLLLQEMHSLPYGAIQPGREEIFEFLATGAPAVLIRNDSVIITGETLLKAFDRLEVAEITAMSLILAQPLGRVNPIKEEQIDAIGKIFLKL